LDARELSSRISNFLDEQKDAIQEIVAADVLVWGPAQNVGMVDVGNAADRSHALNADVLVYGVLRQVNDKLWRLEPQFYLAPEANAERGVEELTGTHALGNRLDFRRDPASQRDVTQALHARLEALSQMIIGLSYLSWGNQEGYQRSAETLAKAALESKWAQQDDDSGQEVLYLFLGNAYLSWAYTLDGAAPERPSLLLQARDAFSTAVRLNANYARSLTGLGNAYYQLARPADNMDQCAWQWDLLDEAGSAFQSALDAPPADKPPASYTDLRAHFGLGRYFFYQAGCNNAELLDVARQHYEQVMDEFSRIPQPSAQISLTTALAHTDLGTMALITGSSLWQAGVAAQQPAAKEQLAAAATHYAQALTLSRNSDLEEGRSHVRSMLPFYLVALCFIEPGEAPLAVLEDTVSTFPDGEAVRAEIIAVFESQGASWEACTNGEPL
jgi:tetratricopeptide (TPR) repeat protein